MVDLSPPSPAGLVLPAGCACCGGGYYYGDPCACLCHGAVLPLTRYHNGVLFGTTTAVGGGELPSGVCGSYSPPEGGEWPDGGFALSQNSGTVPPVWRYIGPTAGGLVFQDFTMTEGDPACSPVGTWTHGAGTATVTTVVAGSPDTGGCAELLPCCGSVGGAGTRTATLSGFAAPYADLNGAVVTLAFVGVGPPIQWEGAYFGADHVYTIRYRCFADLGESQMLIHPDGSETDFLVSAGHGAVSCPPDPLLWETTGFAANGSATPQPAGHAEVTE